MDIYINLLKLTTAMANYAQPLESTSLNDYLRSVLPTDITKAAARVARASQCPVMYVLQTKRIATPSSPLADDLPVMLGTLTVASSAKGDGGLSVRSGHTASTQSGSWPVRKPAVQRLT